MPEFDPIAATEAPFYPLPNWAPFFPPPEPELPSGFPPEPIGAINRPPVTGHDYHFDLNDYEKLLPPSEMLAAGHPTVNYGGLSVPSPPLTSPSTGIPTPQYGQEPLFELPSESDYYYTVISLPVERSRPAQHNVTLFWETSQQLERLNEEIRREFPASNWEIILPENRNVIPDEDGRHVRITIKMLEKSN